MPPKTLAAIREIIRDRAEAGFYEEIRMTLDLLEQLYVAGMPAEWVNAFHESVGVPVDAWPHVLPAAPKSSLPEGKRSGKVNSNPMLLESHRLAIAKGHPSGGDKKFRKALMAAKLSQNAAAKLIGVSPGYLSQCRSGDKRMSQSRANLLEAKTGWKAVEANWPGGLYDDSK